MKNWIQWSTAAAFLGTAGAIIGVPYLAGAESPTRQWLSELVRTPLHRALARFDGLQYRSLANPAHLNSLRSTAPPVTNIGIHVSSPGSTESFANLALGSKWTIRAVDTATSGAVADVDNNGNLRTLNAGNVAVRYLTPVSRGKGKILIRCTFAGKASVQVAGPSVSQIKSTSNSLEVAWEPDRYPASFNVQDMDRSDPVRDIDCRDASIPRDARFAPKFLELIKDFKILRFMDWQNTNADQPVTWTGRHTPQALAITEADGVSIEDMVALARLNHSDAWFNMPTRADDDYVRHFAQYVHENLPADRKVYVELGNEVWNWSFPVSRHVMKEGLDAHMGTSAKEAISYRYAERLIHVMDIWRAVFRDAPDRLVRVAAGQSGDPYRSGLILNYKDLPHHVDAFATAPYFGYDQSGNPSDLTVIFRRIELGIENSLRDAEAQKALAAQHGLRFVAYEAGQGIVLSEVALNQQIQRDPRMYTAYRSYLDGWRKRIGDSIILFGTVFRTRSSGAWGLLEYEGQAVGESPKYRAVKDELIH